MLHLNGMAVLDEQQDVEPTGNLNGSNQDFTLAEAFRAGTLQVDWNGVVQTETDDFVEVGTNGFQMVLAPSTGDTLRCSYYR